MCGIIAGTKIPQLKIIAVGGVSVIKLIIYSNTLFTTA